MTFPPLPEPPDENGWASSAHQPPPPHPLAAPQLPPRLPLTTPRPDPGPSGLSPANEHYDHERSRWGLGDVAWSLAVFYLGSFGLVFLIVAITGDGDSFLQGHWLPIAVVGPHLMLLVHASWVARAKGAGLVNDFRLRLEWSDVGIGFGLFLGGVITAGIVASVIMQVSGETPTASAVELAEDSSADGGLTIWLYLFAILGATFVPLVEELVYRGLLWSALEKRGMQPWPVLIVSSLIFALVHLEPLRTPVLFVIGMAIGAGRLITGRIGASIITHMIINSLAMTATLIELG